MVTGKKREYWVAMRRGWTKVALVWADWVSVLPKGVFSLSRATAIAASMACTAQASAAQGWPEEIGGPLRKNQHAITNPPPEAGKSMRDPRSVAGGALSNPGADARTPRDTKQTSIGVTVSPKGITGPKKGLRALSLKILQRELSNPTNARSRQLLELGGITHLLGYVLDEEQNDIIVYGIADATSSVSLWTEDLVVALRNAWLRYAKLQGNTYIYEDPGCSIDPNPLTVAKLEAIGRNIQNARSDNAIERELLNWGRICKEWQKVRVLGTPVNCRFAWATVQADYDMKRLVDGSDPLGLAGFDSLTTLKLGLVRQKVVNDQAVNIKLAGLNRFWFCPGTNMYEEDDGIVWIKQCPVQLLTREMYLGGKADSLVGGDRSDPIAKTFTENFSNIYDKVAQVRPIYRDLENLFRLVAVSKIIRYKSTNGHTDFERLLSYLIRDFPVRPTSVAEQLEGRSTVLTFQHTNQLHRPVKIYQMWLPSCGGVDIAINPNKRDFGNRCPLLKPLQKLILQRRPNDALVWDLAEDLEGVHQFLVGARLADQNARSEVRTNFRVEYRNSKYRLMSERDLMYEVDSVSELIARLNDIRAFDKGAVFIEVAGLQPNEFKSFRAACHIRKDIMFPSSVLYVADADHTEFDNYEAVLSIGATLDLNSLAAVKGRQMTTATLGFLVYCNGRNRRYEVEFSSDKLMLAPVLERLRRAVIERFQPYGFRSEALLDTLTLEKLNLLKDAKLHDKDIRIRIRTESGAIETSAIIRDNSRQNEEDVPFRTS
jgi:hypothetical protein